MNRDKFLKALQYFDDNYRKVMGRTGDNHKWAYAKNDKYLQLHNRVDVNYVRQITVNNNNCFEPFYALDNYLLFALFEVLTTTELALTYYEDFASKFRDKKQQNRNNALINKMQSIVDYAKEVGEEDDAETLERIFERLGGALNNKHYTVRQVFQNLLFQVSCILPNAKAGANSYRTANITNALIKDYFGNDDISFSRNEDITKYMSTTYHYGDSAGVTLTHS